MDEDKWRKLIDCHYYILKREKKYMLLADVNPELGTICSLYKIKFLFHSYKTKLASSIKVKKKKQWCFNSSHKPFFVV